MQYPGPSHSDPYESGLHPGWRGPWVGGPMGGSPGGPSRRARLLFPVIFSLIVQLPSVFLGFGAHRPEPLHRPPEQFWPVLVLTLIGPLALLAARRFPGPVVLVVAAAAAGDLFVGKTDNAPFYVALAFAIVGAVARGARVWAWISVASAWVLSVTAAIVFGVSWSPVRIAFTTLGILVVFGIGEGARTRADRFAQLARSRAQRRQSEVQAERVRIARELHDVLAHSLSQINVQAGVGLHLIDSQPETARDALLSIKETSKTALDEVRSVLGVLRADGGDLEAPLVPSPDLSRIPELAAAVTRQGVRVTVSDSPREVPEAIQLAIYRIVQESLTNVVRHAKAAHASVRITEGKGFYRVEVVDDGTTRPAPGETDGRGLLGMRERAELLGGTMEAGALADGGFRVAARIPAPSEGRTG